MSEEIMTAAADLTTMVGLRAENDGLRQRMIKAEAELVHNEMTIVAAIQGRDQAFRAEKAERAARLASDADVYTLRTAALAYVRATSYAERFKARAELEVLVTVERPGMLLVNAIAQLQHAWDRLCECADEFGTDAADACAEYRDLLDTAILAVLGTQMKGSS